MPTKYFPGITHAVVKTIIDKETMDKALGAVAHVDLCFGPGDESAIKGIRIRTMSNGNKGFTAHIPKAPGCDIITGEPGKEVKTLALVAIDRVLQKHGLKYNKTYRVLAKEVQEIVGDRDGISSTGVGERPTA